MLVQPWNAGERNVADLARRMMDACPGCAAFILPGNPSTRVVSRGEFGALVDRFAAGLDVSDLPRGARLLLLAPPTVEIFALAVAVLRRGHTLVTIDGRADANRIRHALREAEADVIVASPRVMRWWPFVRELRRTRRVTVGGRVFGARRLGELLEAGAASPPSHEAFGPASVAVIAFSSGNTGLPKRVDRTHAVLSAQHRALLDAFPLPESDVNLPGFPLAVLHNLCRGTTSVLPAVDLRSMAAADVSTVLGTIRECAVTSISGAPAFVARIAADLCARGESLRQMQRIVVGGGPVSRRLAAQVLTAFPCADARIVYGATEAEPIATATLREILDADGDAVGYLAGWPVADVEILIDGPGDVGEILVRGPHVVEPALGVGWHRTGDVGRLDERGRLWLVGRVGAGIECDGHTVHPYVIEARIACEKGVAAAAVVAHGAAPNGELLVQIEPDANEHTVIASVGAVVAAMGFAGLRVRAIDIVPMDARHQSKVDRAALVQRLERGGR